MTHGIHGEKRWYALIVLCLGVLMIVLDSTIVNVALPSIGTDLHFTETALVWVVNAYLLTFGGCLLLGGRLGDLYGQRRMFLAGLVVFTLASLACGLAPSQTMLIAARAVQGLGGAVVSAVSLSLIMNLFTEPGERARAMGVYGFVCAGGGSIGVLLGGLLTSALSWHWIFLVNLPIGIAVYALCAALLPRTRVPAGAGRLDVAGAITVTASLMLAVYGIVGGNEAGWLSAQTVALIGAAVVLLALFVATYGALALGAPVGVAIAHSLNPALIGVLVIALAALGYALARLIAAVPLVHGERMSYASVFTRVLPHGIGLALGSAGFGSIATFVTLYYAARHWPNAALSLTVFGTLFIGARLLFANTIKTHGGFRVAIVSFAFECAGLVLLWLAPVPHVALVGAALTGFGFALIFPALGVEAVALVPAASRGAALSAYSVFLDLSLGITGPLAGYVAGAFGYPQVFLFAALAAAAGVALSVVLYQRQARVAGSGAAA
ncbi:MFS transporter [Burkholderia multivorans]|uniref:MFS transporter n=1 Tax=Burkholderia multivorans TaxID=87883 RepID=UPI000D00D603|nr:MFS transporter [Burkholderia multivorans]PRE66928.1 MFS transporter [Burkholderia multivorans]PRF17055.1 MFS transporter [Burkholderia multivorans]